MKTFIDGDPITQDYLDHIIEMIDAACEAEEKIGLEELDGGEN